MLIPLQCFNCRYYRMRKECEAFPKGIPDEIYTGWFDHAKPD